MSVATAAAVGFVTGLVTATAVVFAIAPRLVQEATRAAFTEMRRQLRENGR